MQVTTKFHVATEPETSSTTRIHPTDIGVLAAKCSASQFQVLLNSFVDHAQMYGTTESVSEKSDLLLSAHLRLTTGATS